MIVNRWWKFAVIRGEGITADLDGRWYEVDNVPTLITPISFGYSAQFVPTNKWEQREDGAVAVVYEEKKW